MALQWRSAVAKQVSGDKTTEERKGVSFRTKLDTECPLAVSAASRSKGERKESYPRLFADKHPRAYQTRERVPYKVLFACPIQNHNKNGSLRLVLGPVCRSHGGAPASLHILFSMRYRFRGFSKRLDSRGTFRILCIML